MEKIKVTKNRECEKCFFNTFLVSIDNIEITYNCPIKKIKTNKCSKYKKKPTANVVKFKKIIDRENKTETKGE